MILGPDRTKLSKRHGAASLLEYREMGYLPQALVNYLVRLGWSHGDEEIFSREEMIGKFALSQIGKSAGVFNQEKLLWLNSHYIKESPDAELAELVIPFIRARGFEIPDQAYLAKIAATLKPRCKTLVEMAEAAEFYLVNKVSYPTELVAKFFKKELIPVFDQTIALLSGLSAWDMAALEETFKALLEQGGYKMKQVAQPIRVALTGKTASPGLFEVMEAMGKERTIGRLNEALSIITNRQS
jgi:glutamyl-tRNA synthetase